MGKKRIIAETGAGQHGVATATVCALMDMPCVVYQGALDVERQHVNVERMKMLGAEVRPVKTGNWTLKDATNEAIRDWCCHPQDTFYIIGSTVGPHPYPDMVARLQSIISAEIKEQLQEKIGRDYPDVLMACVGGGSNAAGTIYHYIDDERVKIILAEAGGQGADTGHTAATIHAGRLGILHGSKTLVMQTPDGQIIEAESISAGLDYPGIGPMHANLATQHRATVYSINDDEAIKAAYELTRMEGIIPALESAHAIAALQKYKTRAEFSKNDLNALRYIIKHGWYDEFCSHFVTRTYWTDDMAIEEARKYNSAHDFKSNCPKAYDYARKHGILYPNTTGGGWKNKPLSVVMNTPKKDETVFCRDGLKTISVQSNGDDYP